MTSNVISADCYIPALDGPVHPGGQLRVCSRDTTPDFFVDVGIVERRTINHAAIAREGFCDIADTDEVLVVTGVIAGEGSPVVVVMPVAFDGCARYWYAMAGTLMEARNAANTAAPSVA